MDYKEKAFPAYAAFGKHAWCNSSLAFEYFNQEKGSQITIGESSGINMTLFISEGLATIEIGNQCTLVGTVIHTNSMVKIGNNCMIADTTVISDTGFIFHKKDGLISKPIIIGNNVWIGFGAMILGGAEIGDNAIIGARAIVNFKVPANSIVAGNPAKIVGHVK